MKLNDEFETRELLKKPSPTPRDPLGWSLPILSLAVSTFAGKEGVCEEHPLIVFLALRQIDTGILFCESRGVANLSLETFSLFFPLADATGPGLECGLGTVRRIK